MNSDTLDTFTRGYIEAAIFTDCNPDSDMDGMTIEDISDDAAVTMVKDCAVFQADNRALLQEAVNSDYGLNPGSDYGLDYAGMDFWYTRGGHGVGFWDRKLGAIGDKLTEASKKYHSVNLYKGDDGKLYLD